MINIERTRISNVLRSVLISVTCLQATLFLMDSGEPNLKKLSGGRFDSIVFLLRVGGILVKMRKLSTIQGVPGGICQTSGECSLC